MFKVHLPTEKFIAVEAGKDVLSLGLNAFAYKYVRQQDKQRILAALTSLQPIRTLMIKSVKIVCAVLLLVSHSHYLLSSLFPSLDTFLCLLSYLFTLLHPEWNHKKPMHCYLHLNNFLKKFFQLVVVGLEQLGTGLILKKGSKVKFKISYGQ